MCVCREVYSQVCKLELRSKKREGELQNDYTYSLVQMLSVAYGTQGCPRCTAYIL